MSLIRSPDARAVLTRVSISRTPCKADRDQHAPHVGANARCTFSLGEPAMRTALEPMRHLLEPLDDDLDRLYRRLGRLLDRDMGSLGLRSDIREEESRYLVDVDMPGVRKSDIDISISGNAVTVQAEFKNTEDANSSKRLQQERLSGECFRSYTFPAEIDAAHASASFDHGVLSLTLPKATQTKAQHVRVS
ncbi:Hsp20/alpha crystallin family protein [Lysobacter sp. TY2-98]|uniref:Hsp20/alpha crystallin family protein n=1 Tax=Lysobacter sp. TY2-98 TaxID=2290922 RepID=UPI000E1FE1F9|nr:Hsp20/alpha crystallin family protein [Lysobacter sp. TY2-98]AXK71053.1 Hsp20/alpha crystallin family protein [Lysobacter sp. TY2-98]